MKTSQFINPNLSVGGRTGQIGDKTDGVFRLVAYFPDEA